MATDREIAIQQQEKFEFYLLSLVFTLLALSVQTSKLGLWPIRDYVEIVGWALLLVSGLAGASYLQMNPVIRLKMAQRDEFREELNGYRRAQGAGHGTYLNAVTNRQEPFAPLIANRVEAIQALDRVIPKLEARQNIKYRLFTYCFPGGLVCVAIARALPIFLESPLGLAV